MKYIALRDFETFKKGDSIPTEVVCDRLIRGRKIGLVSEKETKEIKEIVETKVQKEPELELLTEDGSEVSVVEETVEIIEENVEVTTEKSKKKR